MAIFTDVELKTLFKLKNARVVVNNLMASCPFAKQEHEGGSDNNRSFGINLDTGQWQCYSCENKGQTPRTLGTKLGILLPSDFMQKCLKVEGSRLADPNKKTLHVRRPCKTNFPWQEDFSRWQEAYAELRFRGIKREVVKRFNIGFDDHGNVLFPCVMPDGSLRGWIARSDALENRYFFMPGGVNRRALLFGLTQHFHRIYLTESVTDMLRLCSWGLDAVATCGNMIFEEQVPDLLKFSDEIVIVPQTDIPARKWVLDAKKVLLPHRKLLGVKIRPQFKDVCDDRYTQKMWDEDSAKLVDVKP